MTAAMAALARLRSVATARNMTPLLSRRTYSTKKSANPASQFYKQFTRPIAKTLLIAVFTYQVTYWLWVKGEADEVRGERDATIAGLEATVKAYDEKTKAGSETKSS